MPSCIASGKPGSNYDEQLDLHAGGPTAASAASHQWDFTRLDCLQAAHGDQDPRGVTCVAVVGSTIWPKWCLV